MQTSEELLAISSIFPEALISGLKFKIELPSQAGNLVLKCTLAPPYPLLIPEFSIEYPNKRLKEYITKELVLLFEKEPVLFTWITWLRDFLDTQDAGQKSPPLSLPIEPIALDIISSKPIVEKKSTFIAHLAQLTNFNQVEPFKNHFKYII
jgi:hypothetical protein